MKITHIISTFPPYKGGMGNSAACFAKELVRIKHNITILTPNFTNPADEVGEWEGVKVIRIKPLFKIGNAAILPGILKYLKEFDVVHLHYPFYGTAELVALAKIWRGQKLKLVVHYHMDTRARGLKGLIFYIYKLIWLPIILRLAEEITCSSLDYAKHSDVGAYYSKHHQKFIQVPFGVDLDHFHPKSEPNKPNSAEILFVGGLDRAHYFKGVDILIEAFAQVVLKLPQARLTILGRGDLEPIYKHLVKTIDLEDKVIFINNADDKALVENYQNSDLLILPSINQNEAFGLVLLEAMACGKPIIASNLPGVRSVFKNGKQGLTVKPGDAADLAEKILMIFKTPETKFQMGESARSLVEKRYSWAIAGEKLNEIYYRVRNTPKLKRKDNNKKETI